MNKAFWIIILVIVTIFYLLFSGVNFLLDINLILVLTWATIYYFNYKAGLLYAGIAGTFFELFNFSTIGLTILTVSFVLILIYFFNNISKAFDTNDNFKFAFSGLACNTITFILISSIIAKNFDLRHLVIELIFNSIIFFILIRIRTQRANMYA